MRKILVRTTERWSENGAYTRYRNLLVTGIRFPNEADVKTLVKVKTLTVKPDETPFWVKLRKLRWNSYTKLAVPYVICSGTKYRYVTNAANPDCPESAMVLPVITVVGTAGMRPGDIIELQDGTAYVVLYTGLNMAVCMATNSNNVWDKTTNCANADTAMAHIFEKDMNRAESEPAFQQEFGAYLK